MLFRRRVGWRLIALVLVGQSPGLAGQQPTPPVFRAAVDLVQVDVRVVDANGQFVRDLRRDEFRVFENGVEQPLSTFSLVELPLTMTTAASVAGRRVESDVASNADLVDGRLYVIVMDDRAKQDGEQDYTLRSPTFRAIAREFVEQHMTDADRAAVVATSGRTDLASDFTGNRKELLAAIDRFQEGYGATPFATSFGSGLGTLHFAMQSLRDVATWLGRMPGRRKAMVIVTEELSGMDAELFELAEANEVNTDVRGLVASAARANVALYILDPVGNPSKPAPGIKPIFVDDKRDLSLGRRTALEDLANATGGFALTGSNLFTAAMDRIVVENSSYYLLGYSSNNPKQDGKFRRLRIEVTRPGLSVNSRVGYWADKPASKPTPPPPNGPPAVLTELLKSPLPVAGLSMQVGATVYRGDGARASVAVTVEARGRDLQFVEQNGQLQGSVSMVMTIADMSGRVHVAEKGALTLKLSAANHAAVVADGVRVVQRFQLPRGQYQLKVAAVDLKGKEKGSVVSSVTVPDFSKGPLSMSRIALASTEASRSPTTGSDTSWRKALGMPPTVRREFHLTDDVRQSVEIYDNKSGPDHSIDVVSTVQRESGEVVFTQSSALQQVAKDRTPTRIVIVDLPLRQMGPGRYVLTVKATSLLDPSKPASQELPFSVR